VKAGEKVMKTTEHHTVPPADRVEIVDALYRVGAGQDLRDRALFDSAFSGTASRLWSQSLADHRRAGSGWITCHMGNASPVLAS